MVKHSSYPREAGIYKLTCINNSKSYIGKSVNIYKRLSRHKNCNKAYKGRGFLQNAIIKHGWDSFEVEILEIFKPFDKGKDNNALLERESYYIKLFNTTNKDFGYNLCEFSTDSTGRKLTAEHKEKIRKSHLGKKYSADHRERIKIGKLQNPMSEESRASLREANLGKKMSEEARKKMSVSKIGIKLSKEHKNKIRLGNLGKFVSEETREKQRNSKSEETKKKLSMLYKGKPRSQEIIDKIKRTKQLNRELKELDNQTKTDL